MKDSFEERLEKLEKSVQAIISAFSLSEKPKFFSIPLLPDIEISYNDLEHQQDSWVDVVNNLENSTLRLPTQQELMIIWASLTKQEREKYNFKDESYWTSTEDTRPFAWYVDFDNGLTTTNYKDNLGYARCVQDIIKEK